MDANGWELMGMDANGWELMGMDGNGCEWVGMAENVRIAFSPLYEMLWNNLYNFTRFL
jgi:hypothetical protein